MSELGELYCPFRAGIISAIPLRLTLLIHSAGMLALLLLET
jgi:hypothetical protein